MRFQETAEVPFSRVENILAIAVKAAAHHKTVSPDRFGQAVIGIVRDSTRTRAGQKAVPIMAERKA